MSFFSVRSGTFSLESSVVAAGLLIFFSASVVEDALAKSLPRTEVAKFKAGADLAKALEKVEEKQEKAAEKFKKVLAGQTD
jgi:hypothetical protein